MALGNLADLEELEPTPGRPDPLFIYHQVFSPLAPKGAGRRGLAVLWPRRGCKPWSDHYTTLLEAKLLKVGHDLDLWGVCVKWGAVPFPCPRDEP